MYSSFQYPLLCRKLKSISTVALQMSPNCTCLANFSQVHPVDLSEDAGILQEEVLNPIKYSPQRDTNVSDCL